MMYRIALILLLIPPVLFAQATSVTRWKSFIEWNTASAELPEEEVMGLLANQRNPDGRWVEVLQSCEEIVGALSEGQIPVDQFWSVRQLPLEKSFSLVVNEGEKRNWDVMYGRPQRQGERAEVPLRITEDDTRRYGVAYFMFEEGQWRLDQWTVDLRPSSVLINEDNQAPNPDLEDNTLG
ncbi:MAG: hypothetical protein MI717_05190 [Spirochaetales bacterium]|nr:hypothetical protein [Spirochaetales bacterium]